MLCKYVKNVLSCDWYKSFEQVKSTQANPIPSMILAVDDSEEQLLLISYALMSFDCTFVTALDAQTALSIAREHQPALILLDIVMPKISGIDLVTNLKQHPLTRKIPIIAVTALCTPEKKASILTAGCDEYLCKPYLIEDLQTVVERHLPQTATLMSCR